ncbi:hypothetical protein RKE30_00570 [Streptomyces sp. Li-HN-5-11]|uniref:SCO2400 family protein n=1 Tax=Streptomyces sp. Li-HN-5-11 TaxID=3075432 RepID=UPI0028A6E78F|nr:hypothetical protein [Streptomyces sp. Li-HN-5-11]WNM29003.1 hypothetical protein RKE30_00570 [Streptomyces sp. Li-HN-5-11]
MDYCSSCRRHLNGALVCPGCGAYAPDIAPDRPTGGDFGAHFGTDATLGGTSSRFASASYETPRFDVPVVPVHAPVTPAAAAAPAVDWELTGGTDEAAADGTPDDVTGDVTSERPTWQRPGRAARRRQLARWKKTQRRALVATAVALVGGGLTVATMQQRAAGPAQAAPAPEAPHTDSAGRTPMQHTQPSPAQPGPRHAAPAQGTTAGLPGQRSATQTGATSPNPYADAAAAPHTAANAPSSTGAHTTGSRTTLSLPRTAASSAPAAGSAPAHSSTTTQQTTGSTASGSTGGTSGGTSGSSANSGTSGTSGTFGTSGTSGTSPSATPSSPSQLCLLVVCLG